MNSVVHYVFDAQLLLLFVWFCVSSFMIGSHASVECFSLGFDGFLKNVWLLGFYVMCVDGRVHGLLFFE